MNASPAAAELREEVVAVWDGELEIHVKIAGSGPPLLVLHAAGGPRWLPFHHRLAESHTVYAPELPGTSPGDPYAINRIESFWDLVLIYEELVRALGIEGAAAFGESFGGMLVAELAANFPTIFSKLVLVAPAGLWRDDAPPGYFEMTSGAAERVPEFLFFDPTSEEAQALFALPEDPEQIPATIAWIVWAQACAAKFLWPIPELGLARRLHRVTAPTLIVFGREDRVMPAVYGEEFAKRIAGSRLEVIDRCGHIPTVEAFERTWELVSSFLAG